MSAPTISTITTRMETARGADRREALHECARDVGQLYREKKLSPRQVTDWTRALRLWGERRAGLAWSEIETAIVSGLNGEATR